MNRPASAALTQSSADARRNLRKTVAAVAVVIVLPIVSPSTFLLLIIGLLPSLVALIVDRTPHHSAAICVGASNIAGVAPFLFRLWFETPSLAAATAIVTDVFALAIMYGAAAAGQLLFSGLPRLCVSLNAMMVKRKVQRLRDRQRELVEEWGAEVAGDASEDEAEPNADRAPDQAG